MDETAERILFSIAYLTASAGAGAGALISAKRPFLSAKYLAAGLYVVASWLVLDALALNAATDIERWLWGIGAYSESFIAVPLLLLFARAFVRAEPIPKPLTAAIWTFPALAVILCATNDLHRWMWNGFSDSMQGSLFIRYEPGPAYAFVIGGMYLMVFLSAFILLREAVSSQGILRRRALIALCAVLLPSLVNLFHLSDYYADSGKCLSFDPTPFAFMATSSLLVVGLSKFRFLDSHPIAREALVEEMKDGLFVIDEYGRIADVNPAALALAPGEKRKRSELLGLSPVEAFPDNPDFVELLCGCEGSYNTADAGFDIRCSELDCGQGAGYLSIFRDVTELRMAEKELRILADTDPLTRVFSRRRFFEIAETEFERARRYTRPLSLLIVDLDNFKRINDEYGHRAGDAVLCETAARLQSVIRSVDCLGRYGGDEFLVILPETHLDMARSLAERIVEAIRSEPISWQDGSIPVGASVGAASAASAASMDELLAAADALLYRAKEEGKGRVGS